LGTVDTAAVEFREMQSKARVVREHYAQREMA